MRRALFPLVVLAVVACSPSSLTGETHREGSGSHLVPDTQALANALQGSAVVFAIRTQNGRASGNITGASVDALDSDMTFRIASNTKTFVAVAALKLVEQGLLELDGPIRGALPAPYASLLDNGGYSSDAITLRMLLNHTSGIPDHAQLQSYFDAIMADTTRTWTRAEQVSLAMREGERIGNPGERFSYSDTGYVLVGAMIEHVTGQTLGPAVRALVVEPHLDLPGTWWENLEPQPATSGAPFPQQAFGGPLSRIHPSVDLFGGGGLVSNASDLARFHRAAARGELLDDPLLNAALTTASHQSQLDGEGGYAMGFFIRDYAGETCLEHSGFWGTLAIYCPDTNIAVAAAVTDAQAGFQALRPFFEAAVEKAR